ncbi:hypothetical protein ABK040_005110 [Willaertia magna]
MSNNFNSILPFHLFAGDKLIDQQPQLNNALYFNKSWLIPFEIIEIIMDYCNRTELLTFSKTCKTIYHKINTDPYYFSQIKRLISFKQLITFLTQPNNQNKLLLRCDSNNVYDTVIETFYFYDLLFPYLKINKVKEIKHEKLIYDEYNLPKFLTEYLSNSNSSNSNKTFTELLENFKEYEDNDALKLNKSNTSNEYDKIIDQLNKEVTFSLPYENYLLEVELHNAMLHILFYLRIRCASILKEMSEEELDKIDNEDYYDKNLINIRCCIREIRNYFLSNERLSFLLRVREDENVVELENGLSQILDIRRLSIEDKEDKLPLPIDNTLVLKEEDKEKVPIYYCKFCNFNIGGFACEKCNELLVLSPELDGSAFCKKCYGGMTRPNCCRRPMHVKIPSFEILHPVTTTSPALSCSKCQFSVVGARCFTCCCLDKDDSVIGSSPVRGSNIEIEGFFERVWCAYVWTCGKGCGRKKRGGLYYGGVMKCKSCDNEDLYHHEYIKINGEPCNY